MGSLLKPVLLYVLTSVLTRFAFRAMDRAITGTNTPRVPDPEFITIYEAHGCAIDCPAVVWQRWATVVEAEAALASYQLLAINKPQFDLVHWIEIGEIA